MPPPSDRPNRRQIAADATRDEILRAARRLFAADGYSATSVQAIAAEAGVAVQTIYSSIGSKGAIVVALNDTIDAEAGVMALAMEAMQSSDPRRVVTLVVAIPRAIAEACGDLISALEEARLSDPVAGGALDEGQRRHREGVGLLLARLGMLDALRPGVDLERTADLVSALVDPVVFRRLLEQGWTWDQAEEALVALLTGLLLEEGG